ncbi:MAG TPA: replication protein C, partial [Candidatus Nitrosotenuis sp.]|nr:replication protein C [Candidatus Nitrosotenuis sp.]
SIVTSNLSKNDLARMLDVISEADVLYGKIMRTQEWKLLRYLDNILMKLYREDLPVQYSQYNLSWPLLNKMRWDGKTLKALNGVLAKMFHVSKSAIATFYLPYILLCMKNETLNLELSPEYSEILQKEMDLIK